MQRLSHYASIYTNTFYLQRIFHRPIYTMILNVMYTILWHLPKIISRIQRNRVLMYKVAITENKTYETFCLKRNCSIFN